MNAKPPLSPDRLWTGSFAALLAVSFLLCFGFYMLPATLPAYVTQLGGTPFQASLAIGVFSATSLLSRVAAGVVVDAVGERPVIVIGILAIVATTLSFSWLPIEGILLLRGLQGIGWGLATAAIATAVYKVVPDARRAEGSGYYVLTVIISASLTPMLAILLMTTFDYSVMLAASAFVVFAALPMVRRSLAPLRRPDVRPRGRRRLTLGAVFEPGALLPSLLCFVVTIPLSGVMAYLVLFAREQGLERVWLFFLGYSATVVATRPFIGRLFDRQGHAIIVVPGALSMLLGLAALSQTQTTAMLVASSLLYGFGYGAVHPSLQTWAVNRCPADRKAAANGLFMSAIDLGYIVGAVVLGHVAALSSYATMYACGAAVMVVFLALYLYPLLRARGQVGGR